MDACSDSRVEQVVWMSSAQVGKTSGVENLLGYYVDQDPSPILLVEPTLEMAESFSKERLAPMLRDTPCLQGKVCDARSRDSGNTLLAKSFPGGHLAIAGANSPASLASRPIRVVLCDEVDRYQPSAGTEGDPVSLAKKRSTTFWNRKLILISTPGIKGVSRIELAWEQGDQRRYFVRCPDCGHEQTLRWAQVRWSKGETGEHLPETAVYMCEGCASEWGDAKRWAAVRWGAWRAAKPFRGIASFHLNEIYSPWVKLREMVTSHLEAVGHPELLKVWVNTALGETWADDRGETVDETGLLGRRESYGTEVPAGVAVIAAGVDVQDDRLELELLGFGRGEENWSLDYRVIRADPSTNIPWRELDDLLFRAYRREDGVELRVAAVCVDTGGHHTQAAYAYCRDRYARRVWAVKGASKPGPIWPRRPSKNNIGKVNLFLVGTHAAKDLIYARLRIAEAGPGYCHFPDGRDEEYFRQLTAEKVVTKYSKGFPQRQWVKDVSRRNEALDVRVYGVCALAGLAAMGLDLEREARRLEEVAASLRTNTAPPSVVRHRRIRSPGIAL